MRFTAAIPTLRSFLLPIYLASLPIPGPSYHLCRFISVVFQYRSLTSGSRISKVCCQWWPNPCFKRLLFAGFDPLFKLESRCLEWSFGHASRLVTRHQPNDNLCLFSSSDTAFVIRSGQTKPTYLVLRFRKGFSRCTHLTPARHQISIYLVDCSD
jgi:hypothetical protein